MFNLLPKSSHISSLTIQQFPLSTNDWRIVLATGDLEHLNILGNAGIGEQNLDIPQQNQMRTLTAREHSIPDIVFQTLITRSPGLNNLTLGPSSAALLNHCVASCSKTVISIEANGVFEFSSVLKSAPSSDVRLFVHGAREYQFSGPEDAGFYGAVLGVSGGAFSSGFFRFIRSQHREGQVWFIRIQIPESELVDFVRNSKLFPNSDQISTWDQVRRLVPTHPAFAGHSPISGLGVTPSQLLSDNELILALCRFAQQGFNSAKIVARECSVNLD